jgi:hypothetical protein
MPPRDRRAKASRLESFEGEEDKYH